MTEAKRTSKNVLEARKILEGDCASLMPDSGGFCTCPATSDGVILSTYGSRGIFLSVKNLYNIVEHILEGKAHSTLVLDEFDIPEVSAVVEGEEPK